MSVNIDSLNLQISAESSVAEKSLNRLLSTLGRIKGAVEKASSLSSVTRRLNALNKAAKSLSTLDAQTEKINKLVSSLRQLDTLKGVSLKPFIKSAEMLPSAIKAISDTDADTDKILGITNTLKSFSNLGKNNINPFITSAERLPNLMKSLSDMPDIDSGKIMRIISTLQTFEGVGKTDINPFINSAKRLPEAVSALNNMEEIDVSRLNQVVGSLRTFENLGKNNMNPFLNSLKKIPKISDDLKSVDFDSFTQSIQRTADAVKPLATEMEKVSNGFSSLPTKLQQVIKSNQGLSASNQNVAASKNFLIQGLTAVKIKLAAYGVTLKKVSSILSDYYIKSNEYIEDINLFTVAMGDAADESFNFAQKVNSLMSIDISEWVRNQGVFKSIASGFGVVTEKANLMSKNLTQIAYDISSFYNIDIDKAMTKVQSGISGELEPLRRLGYALDVATLQQVAYSHGITDSISKMTQAQKSLIRYVAIMEQSKNVMGDMSRTITTPANSLRILEQQFEQLKRAIGNIVSVLVAKLIPYIQAFVRLATEAAEALAKAWGFELPEIDYSGLSVDSVTDGVDDLNNALDDTADSANSAKKAMQRLAGFDEINVLKNDTEKSDSNKINTSKDLDIELPEYDFLSGLDESSNKIYEHMKKFFTDLKKWVKDNIPFIKRLAEVIATIWVISKIKKFWDYLKQLWTWFKNLKVIKTIGDISKNFITGFKNSRDKGKGFFTSIKNGFKNIRDNLSTLQKFAITAATTILGAFTAHDFFYNMTKGTLNAKNGFLDIIGMAGSIGTAFALTGPVGGVITTLGVVVGAISGVIQAQQEMRTEFLNNTFFDGEGAKLDTYKTKLENSLEPIDNYTSKVKEMRDAIQESNEKLDNAREKVENFRLKLDGTGELTATEVKEMKTALDDLVKNMKDNFSLNTESIFKLFKQTSGEVADKLGVDVNKMTTILQGFQNTFNTETNKVQASANSYLDKISKGIKVTPEEQKQFDNDMKLLNDLSSTVSENSIRLQEDLKDVKNGAINFEDTDTAKKKIEEIGTTAENTMTGIKDAYVTQKTAIQNLLNKADTLYSYGKISDDEYKKIKKALDDSMKLLEANYDEQKKQAQEKIAEIFGAIQDAYDENILKVAEADGDTSFANMLDIDRQFSEIKNSIQEQCDNFDINLDDFYTKFGVSTNKSSIEVGENAAKSAVDSFEKKMSESGTKESIFKNFLVFDESLKNSSINLGDSIGSAIGKAMQSAINRNSGYLTSNQALKKKVESSGEEIMDWYNKGSINAMNSSQSALKGAGKNSFDSVYKGSYEAGQFGSPSKKTYQLGEWYVDGFVNAVNDNVSDTTKTVKSLGQKINISFSNSLDFDSVKKNAKKLSNTFTKGIDTNNITVTFVSMFDVILQKMQIFSNNLSKTMNTNLTNMVNSVNSVKLTNGTATIGSKMPMIVVPKMYSSGGYPERGEMFMARENGAELVGRIGNKTAVVNNEQIVESIKSGVYEAVMSAKSSDNSNNQPVYIHTTVYLDNDEIYNSVEKRSRREFIRSNGRNKVN